jgi:L-amino acid N-acyltransferase YncA
MSNIRFVAAHDAAALAAIYRPYVAASATSFEVEPPDADEMARRLLQVESQTPWLVLTESDDISGYAYASRHRERAAYQWSVDVAVYVRSDQHRRGVGRALYRALFNLLRVQGFCAAHAGITLPNAASVGLHEAFGFRRVGVYQGVGYKLGAWRDVGWWQLDLAPRLPHPSAPLTIAEARTRPGWKEALAAGTLSAQR